MVNTTPRKTLKIILIFRMTNKLYELIFGDNVRSNSSNKNILICNNKFFQSKIQNELFNSVDFLDFYGIKNFLFF